MATPQKAPVERVYDFGDYERIATLGSGGAATVYRAISRRDGQMVAVKVLQQFDPYLCQKFRKEIEIGMVLRHPHIVRVYGGGESKGVLYIVMEFMDGGTLRDRLYPGQPFPLEQTMSIIGQVCDALQYAHGMQEGIYHRDTKPENIFFSSNGQVKLGDFGIARLARAVTRTVSGWLIGTPAYMSYEQAKGHPIDRRSDIYSLGVVLYEMVTGHCPFMADDPLAIVDMHIRGRPVPPSRINPNVPSAVESVIMRALEKDRNRRFRTAEEMARALGYTEPMHSGEVAPVPAVAAAPAAVPLPYQPTPAIAPLAQPFPSAPMPGVLRLVCMDGTVIPLRAGITPLNRRDVNPSDLEISRQHARVVQRGGYYWIEDVDSSNGTFIDGLRIFSPQVLQPGDEIRLGRTVLWVEE
jgi:serine/threonine-protein kinase